MTIGNPVAILRQKFAQSIGLPFADVLSESDIESALEDEGVTYRKRLFCPTVTLWAWMSQVLDKDKSCKNALSRLISYLVSSGQPVPSTDTSGYCKARKRLPKRLLLRFVRKTGKPLHEQPETELLWCGRRVAVFDGSSMTMADTSANQKNIPNPKVKQKGVGFRLDALCAALALRLEPC